MLVSGLLLLGFIVVHVLHFTTGTIGPAPVVAEMVYANLQSAFAVWFVVAFYLAAMLLLAMHLYHGVWSLFQTLGLDNPDRNRGLRRMALVIAVAVPLAFASVPVAFFTGMMRPPPVQLTHLGGTR